MKTPSMDTFHWRTEWSLLVISSSPSNTIDEIPPCFLGFVKDMLTKREKKTEENQKKRISGALARFYYIELNDYNQAERWAKEAKKRDPKNSFVADTLGQVYKNHLKNKEFSLKPREILQLAKKAIQAFKDEEQLAENEHDTDMKGDGNTKVSHIFNIRGQFGYLQVCNIVYDQLGAQNETWKKVLTQNVSMGSVLGSLGDNKLNRFKGLISSLKDEVEKKCNFLNAYLTFSKPGIQKDDPSYIQSDMSSCYRKYAEHPLPDLILDIMNKFEDNVEENVSPSDADTPEPHIVGLLKEWPDDNNNSSDLMLFIQKINHSYDCAYAKYFRSRYLRPLFYLGKDEAPSRIAPTNNGQFLLENEDATTDFINYMTNNDKIFKDLRVQKNLFKFHGIVQNYKLFATIGGRRIMVNANMQDSLWIQRDVSFYLGFTIRGLVAFNIHTENNKQGPPRSCDSCGGVKDSNWTAATPEPRTENALPTYRLQSEAGHFKCSVSGLRWVCKKKVSFTYQFKSWEEHRQKLNMVHCEPGGPLMDITVTDGELDEVHLPHWVCMGCGGTTLAMQVLWDLRRSFRCAVLTGSTSDIMNVATEVVHLFTAGSRGNQNTVLLLLNDEHILENLQDSIMEKMVQQRIVTNIPVVIFFTCVRKEVLQSDHVILQKALSDTEKQKFDEKKKELSRKYRDKCGQFHGFNIMQTNFSQAYVKQACTVFSTVQRANKPLKTQLATFLSLLNAYVPGSYLLESQCLEFLKHEDSIHGHLSLEDRMEPFSHLIITFQHDVRSGKKVCMAHPMIAQCCTELMGEADVTRSDTARSFLNSLCRDEIPPRLLSFVKDMLTKREMKVEENPKKRINGNEIKEDRERFSRLILDIQRKESEVQSASVLKMASMIFLQNPFFPQALARFYYIELKDYNQAERWAKEAKERDPKNSFVADTLGQVYKNHLKNKDFSAKPRESLKLAKKAIQAFKDEDQLAENEHGADMKEDGNTKVSHIFNIRGQFGYLQVCNIVYDQLVTQNETWKKVLTKNVSMGSVLGSLGDNKLYRFNGLISSLRDEVEKKCNFLNAYLTFSKPGIQKDDPSYIQKDVSSCYCKYTEHPLPDLIRDVMNTFGDNVEENMSPSDADTPEPPIVGLLKEWPGDNNSPSDLMLFVQKINHSYDSAYAKYFQSRYLCPLFYLGEDEALSRIAPTNNSQFLLENDDATTDFINYMMNNDKIFKDLRVNKKLLKFHGVVQNYKLFAAIGGMKVMVNANMRDSLWIQRDVSFYLGFTIRGLVAFGIQTENNKQGPTRSCDSCGSVKDSNWTAATPERRTENALPIYRMQSEAGRFKCSVSGLRWVCKKKVSFTYQFKSWEEHWQKLNMVHCKPGGPLMDITVTDGELDEVHLPHWVCM
eukprot:superscaffoldBa00002413_g14160